MMTYISIIAAVMLFGVMAILTLRSRYEDSLSGIHDLWDRDRVFAQEAEAAELLLHRVFSNEDEEFIAGLESLNLRKLLAEERKKLALHWLMRRTIEARQIMKDHVTAARSAADLRVSGELRLVGGYIELRVLCGLLLVLVVAVGPAGLQRLAQQADVLFVRMRNGKPAAKAIAA